MILAECTFAALVVFGALAWATLREPATGRHGRRRGVQFGTPTQIRRHRRGCRQHAWANTRSGCVRPASTVHAVDEAAPQQHRAANRYEDTGEITQADLEALLGPQPELTGASA